MLGLVHAPLPVPCVSVVVRAPGHPGGVSLLHILGKALVLLAWVVDAKARADDSEPHTGILQRLEIHAAVKLGNIHAFDGHYSSSFGLS